MKNPEQSIGPFQSKLLIFGGPYSNLQSLEALQQEAEKHGITANHVICTGDLVAYCAQPQETVDLIRNWGVHVVQGNCEYSLGNDENDCGCGFAENSACDIASREWFEFSRVRIKPSDKEWMKQLPYSLRFELAGRQVCCLHGSYSEQNEFVFKSTPASIKQSQLDASSSDIVIGGHCGLPFGEILQDNKAWLNAGVIGMPANDGSSSTWYMTIDVADNTIEAQWHHLNYDHLNCQKHMQAQSVSKGYQASLTSGIWPNMDVLPQVEQQKQAQKIKPFSLRF